MALILVVGLATVRYRWAAVALGVLLRAGILLSMNVVSFGILMVGSYPLFVWGPRRYDQMTRAAS